MTALPEEFRQRMEQMLGEEECRLFLSSYERPMARGLRVNTLKTTVDRFRALCPEVLRPVPWCATGFYLSGEEERTQRGNPTGTLDRSAPTQSGGDNRRSGDRKAEDGQTGTGAGGAFRPGKHPWHEAGMYYIQEPSAMSVAALSGTRPGEKILDLCAAPGGKSTQLACMLDGKGLLVSSEIEPERARILAQNLERMGVRNAIVLNSRPDQLAARFPLFYDRVIVDAPCSGEGMFRKEEQALSMWSEENVLHCALRQQEILDEAAKMVRSGGFLEYSTCTFAPEEDEGSIALFLLRHPEFTLVDLPGGLEEKMETYGFSKGSPVWGRMALARLQTWMSGTSAGSGAPAGTRQTAVQSQEARQQEVLAQLDRTVRLFPHKLRGEGHFAALLQREGETGRPQGEAGGTLRQESEEMLPQRRDRKRRGWQDRKQVGQRNASKAVEAGAFRDFASQFIRTDLVNKAKEDGGFVLQRSGDTLFLAPENLPLQGLRVLRQGLELGTVRKGRFEPSHALAMALRPEDALQVRDVTGSSREAAAYLRGESLPCEPALKGWVLVCVDGCSMGWGKASNGMLKNHYPKGLRRDVSTGE